MQINCKNLSNLPPQSQTSQKGQQTAIFNNDGNTQVHQQIGPDSAFNNHPGGKIIFIGYMTEKDCAGLKSNYDLQFQPKLVTNRTVN